MRSRVLVVQSLKLAVLGIIKKTFKIANYGNMIVRYIFDVNQVYDMKIQFYTDYCHKIYQVKIHRSKLDI